MTRTRAIVVLSVPFAAVSLLLLASMCLSPYWQCKVTGPLTIAAIWKPAVFIFVLFTAVAVVVLCVDLVFISALAGLREHYRTLAIAAVGGIVAVVPTVVHGVFDGQGIAALSPQFEFLPFALAGAIFALALSRLIENGRDAV